MAFGSLSKIRLLCRNLGCRHILKNKRHKESTEQGIRPDIIAQESSFASKLSLNTADEYFYITHFSLFRSSLFFRFEDR